MPLNHDWSLDQLADDVAALMEKEAPNGLHLVGAKIAGPVTIRCALRYPKLVKTLILVGTRLVGPSEAPWLDRIDAEGVRVWAEGTMDRRLEGMSATAKRCWTDMMAATPLSTHLGFCHFVETIDITGDLAKIVCPTLVIESDKKARPIAETCAWQQEIANSELVAVPGTRYHAAATEAEECATAAAEFIARHIG